MQFKATGAVKGRGDRKYIKSSIRRENQMKVYVIGAVSILGRKVDRTVTGLKFKTGTEVNEELFAEFFKASNTGVTTEVEVGQGKDILAVSLTDDQEIILAMVRAQFEAAIKRSKGWLVNKVYDDVFSKR